MNFKLARRWATIGCLSFAAIFGLTHHSRAQDNSPLANFYCGTHNGKSATIADHPSRGKITMIIWESNYFINAGYDTQKRCRIISDRFNKFQSKGSLRKIVPSRTNNLPVLCALDSLNGYTGSCPSTNVLMTLKPRDSAQAMVNQIGELNLRDSVNPLTHSATIFEQYGDIKVLNINSMLQHSSPTK